MTVRHKKLRLEWARRYRDFTLEQWQKVRNPFLKYKNLYFIFQFFHFSVLFTDETLIESGPRRSQYVHRGRSAPIRSVHLRQRNSHPPKVMFWASFSSQGVGPLHVCDEILNSTRYLEILENVMYPQAHQMYSGEEWMLQHDNAPYHTARIIKMGLENYNVQVMMWPPNSPDLNPIENIFGYLKGQVRKCETNTKEELIAKVKNLCQNDLTLHRMCMDLVLSMPKRIEACYKSRGEHIFY